MRGGKFLLVNLLFFVITLLIVCLSYAYYFLYYGGNDPIIKTAAAVTEEDKKPPQITDIKIEELTATSTTISWTTDELADSLVNYNIRRDYGITRDPALTKAHRLVVPELLSDQSYYFRVIATDKSGNQNLSNDYIFTTPTVKIEEPETPPPTPTVEENKGPGKGEGEGGGYKGDMKQAELIQKTISMLDQVADEEGLSLIESKIQQEAQEKAQPPVISGDFAKVEVGIDTAVIKWKTDKEANSMVALATDAEYDPDAADPYRWNEGEPNEMVATHEVTVIGLKPATTYHYQVRSRTTLGLESRSEDNTFRTKSILPEIYNLNVSKAEEDSATIEWTTNVPCSAVIEYTDLNTNVTKLEGSPMFVTSHSIRLKDLKFDTYYSAIVKVENEQAEKTVSNPVTFTTIKDMLPPTISKVNTESTLYPGTENKTQTIISWRTDEPSLCQFFYGQGLSMSKSDYSTLPKEEDYTGNHVQVVTAFQPATVYKFWLECYDKTLNRAKSEDYTMLTPAREESILDLIIKNFEGTFGWLKKK
jgi:hypothetical protein